jgi:hypothetical protein
VGLRGRTPWERTATDLSTDRFGVSLVEDATPNEGGAMIARVASFEGVNVDEAERTMPQAESIMRPMVEGLAGYQGHLDLMSADGKALSITIFDSEANARAAERTFDEEMPRQLGDIFKSWAGSRIAVDHFKVLVDSRR